MTATDYMAPSVVAIVRLRLTLPTLAFRRDAQK